MKKKILVTGGAGFLGSHLCEKLLEHGHDIICADNLFTGSKDNIIHLMDNPYFEFLRHDITFPLFVEVDEIYNLACPASPIHYQYDPVQTTKTSVHGSINMLGLAKRTKAKILTPNCSRPSYWLFRPNRTLWRLRSQRNANTRTKRRRSVIWGFPSLARGGRWGGGGGEKRRPRTEGRD